MKTIVKIQALHVKQDKACLIDFHNSVFSQGAKMWRFFIKFRALCGTPKQIICHNSKNAQPISTKFQGLPNLYERHAEDTF